MLSSIALYAQEENTTSTAMVGGMLEIQVPNKFSSDKDENYGADLFFRKHFSFQADNNYFALNAGFVHYKENNGIRNDYTLSLGLMSIMNTI